MKHSFLHQGHPMITAIIAGQTPEEMITSSQGSHRDGAHGIAIDLSDLKPEFRNQANLERIISSTDLPFMFFFYRDDKWGNPPDDERQGLLLCAADAGAAMIDVMGDLYDPSPMEITRNPDAVAKQKRLIETLHGKGTEVIVSSHMDCFRTADQTLEHLRTLEERGPDVVKIVTGVNSADELAEMCRTTMFLKRELKTPFVHLCNGTFSRPHRFIGPALGTSILFAVYRYDGRYNMTQPTIKALKSFLNDLDWNINDHLE